ncbi:hypothetical protein IP954_06540 [Leptospira borgpetersenii serovar Tarassovi]|nr:hypothetical protein [Leptospira borgpetersenii serovar Tarassovi]
MGETKASSFSEWKHNILYHNQPTITWILSEFQQASVKQARPCRATHRKALR